MKTPSEINKEIDEAERAKNIELLLKESYHLLPDDFGTDFTLIQDAICFDSRLAARIPENLKENRKFKELTKFSRLIDDQIEVGFLQAESDHEKDKKTAKYDEAFWHALEDLPAELFEDRDFLFVLGYKKTKAMYSKFKKHGDIEGENKFDADYQQEIVAKQAAVKAKRESINRINNLNK